MKKKTIGIIGGMGPMATVELFKQIIENTQASKDSEHIHIIIDNKPQIPDRTNAILYGTESPLDAIVESAKVLKEMGCDFIIIPCNTSHYYVSEIEARTNICILNMIEETAKKLYTNGYKTVGLLATTGTINTQIYENVLSNYGIRVLKPDEDHQKRIMSFIYDYVKAGKADASISQIKDCFEALNDNGAEAFILGCTELSVANDNTMKKQFDIVDPLHILAIQSIIEAGYKTKGDIISRS